MSRFKTTEQFIKDARRVHGDKYDYSKTVYVRSSQKVIIICPEHGEFEQRANGHLNGRGCINCANVLRQNIEGFITNARLIHIDKYDYNKVNYINNKTKVCIICPEHGEFWQQPINHLNGKGCIKCAKIFKKSTEDFINEARYIHGDTYNYSKVKYKTAKIKVHITCPLHGEFKQTPDSHLRGSGCPICKNSIGERSIQQYLIDNSITFTSEYRHPKCKNVRVLPFDFYIPDYKLLIEYDGEQHFTPVEYFGGVDNFKEVQLRDDIKNKFVDDIDGLTLLRIPYYEFNNINTILDEQLSIMS